MTRFAIAVSSLPGHCCVSYAFLYTSIGQWRILNHAPSLGDFDPINLYHTHRVTDISLNNITIG